MTPWFFRSSVIALAVASQLSPSMGHARADAPPPTPTLNAQPVPTDKRIVLLYSGAKYCGSLAEVVPGSELVLTLVSGEVRHFAAQDVMRTLPAVGADSPTRMVVLKNGIMLRGELVEHIPNDHLTLVLPEGAVRSFAWAELHQVKLLEPTTATTPEAATPRAQLVSRDMQYAGEVIEYVPDDRIALQLAGGEIRRFPLKEVQQLQDFTPVRPPPPPAPPPPQKFLNGYGDPREAELSHQGVRELPSDRKNDAKSVLITGGVFGIAGVVAMIAGTAILKSVRNPDQDFSVIVGLFTLGYGGINLAIAPVFLGLGGYRYTKAIADE